MTDLTQKMKKPLIFEYIEPSGTGVAPWKDARAVIKDERSILSIIGDFQEFAEAASGKRLLLVEYGDKTSFAPARAYKLLHDPTYVFPSPAISLGRSSQSPIDLLFDIHAKEEPYGQVEGTAPGKINAVTIWSREQDDSSRILRAFATGIVKNLF